MSGLEDQSIWLVLVAPAAGIIGAILGVVGAGLVQWRLQEQRLQDAERQSELTRSHELDKLKLDMTWKAKLEALERVSQTGTDVYLQAWRIISTFEAKPVDQEQERLQVLVAEFHRAFGHALLYLPFEPDHSNQGALTNLVWQVAKDVKVAAERDPQLRASLQEAWLAFSNELKAHLPVDAMRSPDTRNRAGNP